MKTIILILIYIGVFFGLFFLLSLFGIFWQPYKQVISTEPWFQLYSVFIGWWVSIFPAVEYLSLHKDYFKRIF